MSKNNYSLKSKLFIDPNTVATGPVQSVHIRENLRLRPVTIFSPGGKLPVRADEHVLLEKSEFGQARLRRDSNRRRRRRVRLGSADRVHVQHRG